MSRSWSFRFSDKFNFNVQNKQHSTWMTSCFNDRRVWCEGFFSKPSTVAQTFALHQWIEHKDRTAKCFDLFSFHEEYWHLASSVSSSSHSWPQWASLLTLRPALIILELFSTRRCYSSDFSLSFIPSLVNGTSNLSFILKYLKPSWWFVHDFVKHSGLLASHSFYFCATTVQQWKYRVVTKN